MGGAIRLLAEGMATEVKRPLFSCVVPVKGGRPYLAEALASLRAQGMGNDLEVIIQDGDVEPDAGQSDALNKGFAKAQGAWLFWLNADDVLLPGALRAVARAVRQANGRSQTVDWVSGNLQYLDSKGHVLRCAWDYGRKWMYRGLPVRVYGPSSFFRRELYEGCQKSGCGFDTNLHYMMDIDLWERFRKAGFWHHKLARYVWGFRVHGASLTSEDLLGRTPFEMDREYQLLDRRYGTCRNGVMSKLNRVVRWLDGSYLHAAFDTWRVAGKAVRLS